LPALPCRPGYLVTGTIRPRIFPKKGEGREPRSPPPEGLNYFPHSGLLELFDFILKFIFGFSAISAFPLNAFFAGCFSLFKGCFVVSKPGAYFAFLEKPGVIFPYFALAVESAILDKIIIVDFLVDIADYRGQVVKVIFYKAAGVAKPCRYIPL
jgi:hypothetical protein